MNNFMDYVMSKDEFVSNVEESLFEFFKVYILPNENYLDTISTIAERFHSNISILDHYYYNLNLYCTKDLFSTNLLSISSELTNTVIYLNKSKLDFDLTDIVDYIPEDYDINEFKLDLMRCSVSVKLIYLCYLYSYDTLVMIVDKIDICLIIENFISISYPIASKVLTNYLKSLVIPIQHGLNKLTDDELDYFKYITASDNIIYHELLEALYYYTMIPIFNVPLYISSEYLIERAFNRCYQMNIKGEK